MEVSEGGLTVEVPEERHGASEGSGPGVFYNPVQELNRDVTVGVLRAVADDCGSYLDAMTASGVRAVRAADAGYDVTACDVDEDAVALARRNLDANGLGGEVHHRDVNAHMHEHYHDVVDLDPFGTPVPFADAAVRSGREYLCVTATDTAPLCGAHFESGVRTYAAVPRNTEYHAEMGVRILLSGLARTGARYDVAVRPLLTHATKHYVRTYLALDRGATVANEVIESLGYIHHCRACLTRTTEEGLIANPPESCPSCGEDIETAGPVWLAQYCDEDFLGEVRENIDDEMGTAGEASDLTETLEGELAEPTHYDQHRLCKNWGRPASGDRGR